MTKALLMSIVLSLAVGCADSAGAGGNGGNGGDGGGDPGTLVMGNGCAGGACQNPTCMPHGTAAAIGMYPDTGFDPQPSYIPTDTIIPTFDDVPDGVNSPVDPVYGVGNWTKGDVDFMKTIDMHADMFINTNN